MVSDMTLVTAPPATWQSTLFGASRPALQPLDRLERVQLDDDSWIDVGRDMVHGTDQLFAEVHDALPWQAGERPMYDRMVKVPRLCAFVDADDHRVPAVLTEMADAFTGRYERRFDQIGANLYRDGSDSVAWHSDRVGRRVQDPVIGILSLGGSRVFRLRPKGGGPGRSVPLHSGDILVMGGACQHRWEHTVPKVRRAQPRISITIRHDRPGTDDPPERVWV